jgi:hypothetical protein
MDCPRGEGIGVSVTGTPISRDRQGEVKRAVLSATGSIRPFARPRGGSRPHRPQQAGLEPAPVMIIKMLTDYRRNYVRTHSQHRR